MSHHHRYQSTTRIRIGITVGITVGSGIRVVIRIGIRVGIRVGIIVRRVKGIRHYWLTCK